MKQFGCYLAAAFAFLSQASALVIDIDYTYAGSFFDNSEVKNAFQRAALDVQNVITSSLESVPSDSYVGEFGFDPSNPTYVTLRWKYLFNNPTTGASVNVAFPSGLAADTFKLFVGAHSFPDSAPELGEGGPVGFTMAPLIENGWEPEFPQAMAAAESLSNQGMTRGAGPTVYTLNGQETFDDGDTPEDTTASYSLQVGPLAGVISMNSAANWHLDPETMPESDEFDFYSVALHEILHTLGIGTSETWDSLVDGENWLGSEVIELFGTGVGMVNAGGDHIAEGKMSLNIETGLAQEAAMDPTIQAGTRKGLTELDLAFLRDIGYSTITVPEPATMVLLAFGAIAIFLAAPRGHARRGVVRGDRRS